MSTAKNQAELLKLLPNLMSLVTKAQARLSSIESHVAIAQDGVFRSSLPAADGEPQFTPQFEENSEIFLVSVQEVGTVFEQMSRYLEQIELATAQIVVGVEKQLEVPSNPRS